MIEFVFFISSFAFVAWLGSVGVAILATLVFAWLSLLIYNKYAKSEAIKDLIDFTLPAFGSFFWFLILIAVVYLSERHPLEQETRDLIVKTTYIICSIPFIMLVIMPPILHLIDKYNKKQK